MKFGCMVVAAAAFVALLTCARAAPQHNIQYRQSGNGAAAPTLDPLGGPNLVKPRQRRYNFIPYLTARRDEFGPYVHHLQNRELNYPVRMEAPKRNFDEIDRTGIDNFFGKRTDRNANFDLANFDEIDRTGLDVLSKRALYDEGLYER